MQEKSGKERDEHRAQKQNHINRRKRKMRKREDVDERQSDVKQPADNFELPAFWFKLGNPAAGSANAENRQRAEETGHHDDLGGGQARLSRKLGKTVAESPDSEGQQRVTDGARMGKGFRHSAVSTRLRPDSLAR